MWIMTNQRIKDEAELMGQVLDMLTSPKPMTCNVLTRLEKTQPDTSKSYYLECMIESRFCAICYHDDCGESPSILTVDLENQSELPVWIERKLLYERIIEDLLEAKLGQEVKYD